LRPHRGTGFFASPSEQHHRVAWQSLRRHTNQARTAQDQIGFRRTGDHRCLRLAKSRPGGLYPDPSYLHTFCREPVGSSGGETDDPGRSRALAALTKDGFTPSPATGSALRGAQGVFCLEEPPNHLAPLGKPSRNHGKWRVGLSPQVVPNLWKRGPRLSFTPRQSLL
jgi:hypothetical protein